MIRAYYNEIDTYCCDWLSNLMDAGLITPGKIDERSIADIAPDELIGYVRCHFFAGLGGWDFALQRAGWPDDRPVWTGSCPCQPFSVAGKQAGFNDDRHLWPHFKRLISECRPSVVFGEQVAGASDWLRLVRSDLEEMGYAVGCVPIQAASAGADHYWDRYWLVAHAAGQRWNGQHALLRKEECGRIASDLYEAPRRGEGDYDRALADSDSQRSQIQISQSNDIGPECETAAGSRVRDVVNDPSVGWGEGWAEHELRSRGFTAAVASIDDCQYIECPDGKWRRLPPPRVRWLGNGIPARVAKLRAFGNAIDPRPAAQFIEAYLEATA